MFEPFHTISLGPLTISLQMLFFLLSIALGYIVIYFYLKKLIIEVKDQLLDALLTSVIIGVVVYKLWPFILQPSLLTDFRNIIYYVGGPYAVYTAIASGTIYLIIQSVRKKWSFHCWDSVLIGILSMMLFYSLFIRVYGEPSPFSIGFTIEGVVYHPVNLYEGWLYFLLLFASIILVSKEKSFARTVFILFGIIFVQIIVSPFTI